MTYSILGLDSETGCIGVAVQSHFFGVGRIVPWGEAGVGAVATQSFIDPSYGPLGLALMRAGKGATAALRGLVEADPNENMRQVAMIDRTGETASHTGSGCVPSAGFRSSAGVSVQGNMLASDQVLPAMLEAYEDARGSPAARLLAALDAAESEGGDIRGRQSAAILVVAAKSSGRSWIDRVSDLRVDDHPEPLTELRRLVAYDRFYASLRELVATPGLLTGRLTASEKEIEGALRHLASGQDLLTDNHEATVWRAILLGRAGRVNEGREILQPAVQARPELAEFVQRLPAAGVCTSDVAEALVADLIADL